MVVVVEMVVLVVVAGSLVVVVVVDVLVVVVVGGIVVVVVVVVVVLVVVVVGQGSRSGWCRIFPAGCSDTSGTPIARTPNRCRALSSKAPVTIGFAARSSYFAARCSGTGVVL